MPPEIGNMTELMYLIMYNNDQLAGSIPAEIGNLTSLTFLNLQSCQLTGTIPIEIGNLTSLTSLFLDFNHLSGAIPAEIGNLTSLIELNLSFNQLSGPIPAEISNLTSLTTLALGGNPLTGTIPTGIGNLTSLAYLHLSASQLSGTIPTGIGNLPSLLYLFLGGSQFNILPDFSSAAWAGTIIQFSVGGNLFNFGDIVPNISLLDSYSPQGNIDEEISNTVFYGNPYTVTVSDQYTGNVYQWYKDGEAISDATSFSYENTAFSEGDEGGADEGASRPLGILGVGGEDHQHHGFGEHVREAV